MQSSQESSQEMSQDQESVSEQLPQMPTPSPRWGKEALRLVLDFAQIIGLAMGIVFIVHYFLIQPFLVKGASMEPNYHENEYLIVDALSYRFRDPLRGETVVFHPPGNESQYYIKRVIGLPGETVEIRDGAVTIYNETYPNGKTLEETYLTEPTTDTMRTVLGKDEYFLMGDNRDASLDSRRIGAVPFDHFAGRVWIRGYPFSAAGVLEVPTYNL